MAENSELETRLCLVWNTVKPEKDSPRVSSHFCLLDSVWRLRLLRGKDSYELFLKREVPPFAARTKLEKSFRVTALVQNLVKCDYRDTETVEDTERLIWSFRENMPDWHYFVNDGGRWRVMCLFRVRESSVPQNKNKTILVVDQDDLEFPHHLEDLSLDFSKYLNKREFKDLELRCGDSTVHAHKAILAARSEVFRNKIISSGNGAIDVTDLNAKDLKLLLEYMYTGVIKGSIEDVLSLYKASDKYAVQALKEACVDWMIKELTEENFVTLLTMADEHKDDRLKEEVISFISRSNEVLQSAVWSNFCKKPSKLVIEVYQRFVSSQK